MLDVSNSHDDGDHIGVINLIEIFFTTALVTRVNVQVQETTIANERLDFQCGEV